MGVWEPWRQVRVTVWLVRARASGRQLRVLYYYGLAFKFYKFTKIKIHLCPVTPETPVPVPHTLDLTLCPVMCESSPHLAHRADGDGVARRRVTLTPARRRRCDAHGALSLPFTLPCSIRDRV